MTKSTPEFGPEDYARQLAALEEEFRHVGSTLMWGSRRDIILSALALASKAGIAGEPVAYISEEAHSWLTRRNGTLFRIGISTIPSERHTHALFLSPPPPPPAQVDDREKVATRSDSPGDGEEAVIDRLIARYPDYAKQAAARQSLAGWFVGQAMYETNGRGNVTTLTAIVAKRLEALAASPSPHVEDREKVEPFIWLVRDYETDPWREPPTSGTIERSRYRLSMPVYDASALTAARAEEREWCAKVADDLADEIEADLNECIAVKGWPESSPGATMLRETAKTVREAARRIRAGGA